MFRPAVKCLMGIIAVAALPSCSHTHRLPFFAKDQHAGKPASKRPAKSVRASIVQVANAPSQDEEEYGDPLETVEVWSVHHNSVLSLDDVGKFSLADFERMALSQNPTLTRADARVEAARGNWEQVGLKPNPVFGYIGNEIGNEHQAGQQGAFLSQQFITAGKLELNRAVAFQDVDRAEKQVAAQRLRVLNDVRNAFYRSLLVQKRVTITKQLSELSREFAERSDALQKNDEATIIDVLQARNQSNAMQLVLQNAQTEQLIAWRQLVTLAGGEMLPLRPLTGDIENGLPKLKWESARTRLQAESPEMAIALTNVERAEWALSRACAGQYPNFTGQVAVQYDDATDNTVASVQLGVPLQIYNRNQGNIYRAQSELRAAELEVQRVGLNLENRLAVVFGRYATASQQMQMYSKDILPNAKKTVDLVRLANREGEVDYLRVLIAQRTYFQSNLAYLDALGNARAAATAIDGLLLTGSLQDRN